MVIQFERDESFPGAGASGVSAAAVFEVTSVSSRASGVSTRHPGVPVPEAFYSETRLGSLAGALVV